VVTGQNRVRVLIGTVIPAEGFKQTIESRRRRFKDALRARLPGGGGRYGPCGNDMTMLDALADPNLLGAVFPDAKTWAAWRAFLAALFGLPMPAEQMAVYQRHTGRVPRMPV
jgi:hypothetical protein